MPPYRVTITRKDVYVMVIEANREAEAEEIAFHEYLDMSDEYQYQVLSDDLYIEAEKVNDDQDIQSYG